MLFKNKKTTLNQRAASYVGEVATVYKDISFGKGRVVMNDRTSWLVFCDYDVMANAKVLIIGVSDSLTLLVKPIEILKDRSGRDFYYHTAESVTCN